MLDVGETALVLAGLTAPAFFFLILMPGTGAEFRASRKPVHSIAAERTQESCEPHDHVSCLMPSRYYKTMRRLKSDTVSHLKTTISQEWRSCRLTN